MTEGEGDIHFIVFDLTYLAERQKLNFIDVRVGFHYFLKQKNIILIIVKRRDRNLTDGGGDISFWKDIEKSERLFDRAADVIFIIGIVCVLYIEQNTVTDVKKGENVVVYDAARRIEAGVDSFLLTEREQLTDKIRLK